jgi:hypothetical protein
MISAFQGSSPPSFVPTPVIRTTSGTSSSWSDGNLNIPNMRGDGYRNSRNERHRGGGRGADHDGGHREGQGGNQRNVSSYTPYKPPRFDSEETVVFSGPGGYISPSEWNASKLDRPSVKRILFIKSFAIHECVTGVYFHILGCTIGAK